MGLIKAIKSLFGVKPQQREEILPEGEPDGEWILLDGEKAGAWIRWMSDEEKKVFLNRIACLPDGAGKYWKEALIGWRFFRDNTGKEIPFSRDMAEYVYSLDRKPFDRIADKIRASITGGNNYKPANPQPDVILTGHYVSMRKECPHCGAYLPVETTVCANCGVDTAYDEEEKICPNCAADMATNQIICNHCGANFLKGHIDLCSYVKQKVIFGEKETEICIHSPGFCYMTCLFWKSIWDAGLKKFAPPECSLFKEKIKHKYGVPVAVRCEKCKQLEIVDEEDATYP